jgi:hypothetical protein
MGKMDGGGGLVLAERQMSRTLVPRIKRKRGKFLVELGVGADQGEMRMRRISHG